MNKRGPKPSTALFSPARSSSTSWVPTYYTPLVKPIHGLISIFSPVGRLFGTSRPNTSMGARVTVRVVPNMEALPCLQIPITDCLSICYKNTHWVPCIGKHPVYPPQKNLTVFQVGFPWSRGPDCSFLLYGGEENSLACDTCISGNGKKPCLRP